MSVVEERITLKSMKNWLGRFGILTPKSEGTWAMNAWHAAPRLNPERCGWNWKDENRDYQTQRDLRDKQWGSRVEVLPLPAQWYTLYFLCQIISTWMIPTVKVNVETTSIGSNGPIPSMNLQVIIVVLSDYSCRPSNNLFSFSDFGCDLLLILVLVVSYVQCKWKGVRQIGRVDHTYASKISP